MTEDLLFQRLLASITDVKNLKNALRHVKAQFEARKGRSFVSLLCGAIQEATRGSVTEAMLGLAMHTECVRAKQGSNFNKHAIKIWAGRLKERLVLAH